MRRARPLVYCLIAAVMLLSSACSQSTGDAKGVLQKKYEDMNAAVKAKNVANLMAPIGDDFEQVNLDKTKYDKKQLEREMGVFISKTRDVESSTTLDQVSVAGDRADVVATTKQKGVMTEAENDKATHTFEITSTMKDVWKLRNGDWQLIQSTEVSHAALKDGKPFKP